jgi:hypothetical protein
MKILMKTKLVFFLSALLFSAMLTSCKSGKSLAKTTSPTNSNEYRVVVSFLSKGSGIDNQVHESFLKFVTEHPEKPKHEVYRWGREGEVDYCLQLSEFKSKSQKEFVENVKKIIGGSDMVQISENSPCVHKK